MNNLQHNLETVRNYFNENTDIPPHIWAALSAINEQLKGQFIVLTVTRDEIDDLFGDKVGERMTDGQMTEIAAHMENNEFLQEELTDALKNTMLVLHDLYTGEDDE